MLKQLRAFLRKPLVVTKGRIIAFVVTTWLALALCGWTAWDAQKEIEATDAAVAQAFEVVIERLSAQDKAVFGACMRALEEHQVRFHGPQMWPRTDY